MMVKVWLFKKFDIVGGENKRSKCCATQEAIRGIKSAERIDGSEIDVGPANLDSEGGCYLK
jgi:hypothetical protein